MAVPCAITDINIQGKKKKTQELEGRAVVMVG